MMKCLICLCLLTSPAIATASAQALDDPPQRTAPAPVLPPVILSGLDGYKSKGGAEEAIRLWIRDSPLEGSKEATAQVDTLHQAESTYGAYQWYEIVRTREISPRTLIVYLVLDYERGPLFARFVVYRSNHRWIMTYFDFNAREESIFPQPVY